MKVIVLGAQFGDEGKGLKIGSLATLTDICLRVGGGSNCGHSFRKDNKFIHTHLVPSGIIEPNVLCLMGNGMVINLVALFREFDDLTKNLGDELVNRIRFSNRAHITFLIHCLIDDFANKAIGSTKQGVGPTYADKASRIGIRMDNLLNDNYFDKISALYSTHTTQQLQEYIIAHPFEIKTGDTGVVKFTSIDQMLQYDLNLIATKLSYFRQNIIDVTKYLHDNSTKNILIEGANAAMLDIDFGTYPYVTSSNCTIGGVLTGAGLTIPFLKDAEIVGVTKCYITRVGGGCLPTEDTSDVGKQIQQKGGEMGVTTGRLRRCGWLDLPQLKYSCMVNGFTCLNITKIDVLNFLDKIKVCTSYLDANGEIVDVFPSNEELLSKITPVYTELDGWKDYDISSVTDFNSLHPNILAFIKFVEDYVGVSVKYVNTGKELTNVITRQL